jgi:competence/damage-inducible protein CinA-like protein
VFRKLNASIIVIGSELSSGKIQDNHGKYISSRLSLTGFCVDSIVLIPDNENISKFLESRKNKIDLVIITGGLGPTSDDITRNVIAKTACVDLVLNDDVWEDLLNRFPGHNNESRKKQAYIPEGFSVLQNYNGTAPGFSGYIGSTLIYCLPGPPLEMQNMFEKTVLPDLIRVFNLWEPETFNVSCFLICESALEDACKAYNSKLITWGTRVQPYKISLYLQGGTLEDRQEFYLYLQNYFGKELIAEGDIDIAEILSNSLHKMGKNISIAESITGGLIASLITDIYGSSQICWGSLVTYTNSAKRKILGIKDKDLEQYGAVSKEIAEQMADSVMKLANSDLSLAVSGYAGSLTDKTEDTGKVWIALKISNSRVFVSKFIFMGSRDLIRRKTAIAAMILAETALSSPERLDSCGQWQYS